VPIVKEEPKDKRRKMESTKTILRAGYGYWDTTQYPIGGCFKRADRIIGKEIAEIVRTFSLYRGCDTEVKFIDGSFGACKSSHIELQ
jgi:hypothetical protein